MYHKHEILPRSEVFVLATDVDLTLVDTLSGWLNYINEKSNKKFVLEITGQNFDIEDIMKEWLGHINRINKKHNFQISDLPDVEVDTSIDLVKWFEEKGIKNSLDYWKQPHLYDGLIANESLIDFYNRLVSQLTYETGKIVQTVVVSSCFPEHEESKKNFVKRVFGENVAFISTHSKHLVDFDLLVDDNIGVVFNCLDYGKKILYAPSPLSKPSLGITENPNFFYPSVSSIITWPYDWKDARVDTSRLISLK